jgi:hypothetical protein
VCCSTGDLPICKFTSRHFLPPSPRLIRCPRHAQRECRWFLCYPRDQAGRHLL